MSQLPKLSITEKRVLLLMLEQWRCESNVVTFVWLAERIGASRASIKRACRSLSNKNLTEHSPYWTDDGFLGGSGYTLTCQGMGDVRYHEEALKMEVAAYDAACKKPAIDVRRDRVQEDLDRWGTNGGAPEPEFKSSGSPLLDNMLLREARLARTLDRKPTLRDLLYRAWRRLCRQN